LSPATRRAIWLGAAAACALACNAILGIDGKVIGPPDSDGGPTADTGAPATSDGGLVIQPLTPVRVLQGGSAHLTVRLERDPATDAVVNITVDGEPSKVHIAPASVSGDGPEVTADVEITAETFAPRGRTSLTITVAGRDPKTANVDLTVEGPIDTAFGVEGLAILPFNVATYAGDMIGLDVRPDFTILLSGCVPAGKGSQLLAFDALSPDGADAGLTVLDAGLPSRARAVGTLDDGTIVLVGVSGSGAASAPVFEIAGGGGIAGAVLDGGSSFLDLVVERNVAFAVGANKYWWIVDGGLESKPNTPKINAQTVELADGGMLMLFGRWGAFAATARMDADSGTLDPSFGEAGVAALYGQNSEGWGGTVDTSGRILVAGEVNSDETDAATRGRLSRVTPEGLVDETYGDAGHVTFGFKDWLGAEVRDVVALPNGAALVVGNANQGTLSTSARVGFFARVLPNGALDPSFGDGGAMLITLPTGDHLDFRRVAMQGSAAIIAGTYKNPAGNVDVALLRVNP
jgi:uncharacterized delta-60 repeat protein